MKRHVALVVLALALAGCGDTTIKPEAAPPETTTTTAVVPFTSVVTTRATLPATTTTARPTTEGPLGTTFTVSPGDRKITAFTFKAPVESANRLTTPKAGMQFVAAEVQECAGPAGERFSPNRYDFELAMTDNTRVDPGIEIQTPQLSSSPLLPGDCIRGWVSFEMLTTATVKFIVYSEGNASAKWRVS